MQDFQDGQTQTIGNVTYVRQNGQWHAQNEAPAAMAGRPIIQQGAPAPSAPSGYRFTNEGTLQAIPGGPADPARDAPKIGASSVSGEEYLKTLDPGTASLVKALAAGRKAFPSGAALRSPYWQEILTHVSNYDPGFDEVNYTGRAGTRRDFTSGKAANNIRALNTAIGHLGHLEEQIGGTASHAFTPLNAVENAGRRILGDSGPTNFDTTVSALAGELTAVYRGAGGAEADIQRYIQQLNPNASREQKEGAVRNIVGLLKSRLDALNDQYRQGMGTTAQQLQLLDPQAQLIVDHLGGFDAAGSPDSAPSDAMAPATGTTKEIVDPSLTPVRREYLSRLEQGQSGTELVNFLRKAGITDSALLRSAAAQAKFRKEHPEIPVSSYSTERIDHITQQMGGANQLLNQVGQSDLGAGIAAAGNAVTGGYLPEVVGATGGNTEQARLALQFSGRDHPGAALTGGIVGGTTAALGGEAALAKGAGMAPGFARSLVADSGYGALAGSGASPEDRTEGAVLGAAAGAAGSVAGQAVARGASAALRGVTGKDVNALAQQGVEPMTVGQIVGQSGRVGQFVKGVEDRLSGFAGAGTMINARRAEGLQSFNSKAFDKALEPIGAKVDGAAGEEAVAKAHDAVTQAFSDALKGKSAVPDDQFVTSARGPIERLARNKRVGPEIVDAIEGATEGLFDADTGALSGENMQAFLQGLRKIRDGYKADPLYQTLIKPSIQGVETAVEGMFKRQAPEVMPKYNAAKAAYRRLSILSDAVNRGKNTEGVFTPGQLGMADRANAKKFDGAISASSGESPFFDLQRSGQNVLPNKVPDSGTAGRLAMVAGHGSLPVVGGTIGFLGGDTKSGAEAGLGLSGMLMLAYSKRGQAQLAKMLISRSPRVRAAAEEIMKRIPMAGAAGTALTQTGSSQ